MERHLNTLFITTEGTYLSQEGQTVKVRRKDSTLLRVPLLNLDGIVCFGGVSCSSSLMAACAEAGVSVSFHSRNGRFQAAVTGYSPGNVLLRRAQYRNADSPERSCAIARNLVAAKIANCRTVLLRVIRENDDDHTLPILSAAANSMRQALQSARTASSLDVVRGCEGVAAATYFGVFQHLLTERASRFQFHGRSRRPPLDEINSLLSFLYAILTHDCRSACESAGLDSAVGFLHRDRPGRPGMALDLMEEFRPFLVDRLVLSLLNRKQLKHADFDTAPTGAVALTEHGRRTVLTAWQKRKQEHLMHPFLEEKTTIGLLVHLQARLMARYLRGDLDAYPPFLSK